MTVAVDNRRPRSSFLGPSANCVDFHDEQQPRGQPSLLGNRGLSFKLSSNKHKNEQQRPALPKHQSFTARRRMALDPASMQLRLSGSDHSQGNNGIFTTFRRLSCDAQQQLPAETTTTNYNPNQAVGLFNYQEVFQQMKSQNPGSSLGALHQKTLARLAKLKAQTLAEEAQLREQQRIKDEEERLRNQSLAGRCVDKFVGRMSIYNNNQQSSHGHNGLLGEHYESSAIHPAKSSESNNHYHEPQHFRNSIGSSSSHGIETHFMPTGSRPSILASHRRTSVDSSTCSNKAGGASSRPSLLFPNSHRRSSVDSTAQSSMGDTGTTSKSTIMEAGSLHVHDQAVNFAPRKSVGDLTSNEHGGAEPRSWMDDKSVQSFLSEVSGLYMDGGNSVSTKGTKKSCLSSLGGTEGVEDFFVDEKKKSSRSLASGGEEGGPKRRKDRTTQSTSGTSTASVGSCTSSMNIMVATLPSYDENDHQNIDPFTRVSLSQLLHNHDIDSLSSKKDSKGSRASLSNLSSARSEDASVYTADYSLSMRSLIEPFINRNPEEDDEEEGKEDEDDEDEDDEDGLIVGFGDRRDKRKEDKEEEGDGGSVAW